MLLLLIALLFLLSFLFIRKKAKSSFTYWKERGVKHVEPWSIFGNMTSVVLRRKAFAEVLQELYEKFSEKRYFGFYKFLSPTVVIKDTDLIKQICIKDFDKFPDHIDFLPKGADPFWKNGLFSREGKEWHDMRVILSPAFTSSKMKGMFYLMVECAQEFINHFENQNSSVITVDMKDTITKLTNDVIASCAFGFKCNSFKHPNNEFYLMGKEAFDFSGIKGLKLFGMSISPTIIKIFKVTMFGESFMTFIRRIVKESIQYRKRTGMIRPDMIHLLMEAQKGKLQNDSETPDYDYIKAFVGDKKEQENKSITDEDIACQAAVFVFGAYDTVASLLCNATYELTINPDVQEKLIQEVDETLAACKGKITYEALTRMKYLDMIISETLRMWSPAFVLNRKCVKPFTIEPQYPGEKPLQIEPGIECMIPAYAIHRDPKYFPNPNKFLPERFSDENKNNIQPFTYLPFGIGPRFCIGNRFALMEAKLAIFHLLAHFKLVPVEKTSIPFVIDKTTIALQHAHGYWLGLKRRHKMEI